MQYRQLENGFYILRIERKEKIIESLKKFCQKKKIQGGFFYGLGAVEEVELAHYNVTTKKYSAKKFIQPLEMSNITGNLGVFKNDFVIHAHAAFADKKMMSIAGHLVEAKVSGTAEVFFIKTKKLTKFFDPDTGLKLFKL